MDGWNLTGASSAPAKEEDAVSVSQAIDIAAGALDRIPQLCVLGEVTGFRGPNARSGHCYFQIKDDSSAMDCIIWKGTYLKRASICATACRFILRARSTFIRPRAR